jgi:hypothetical protein
MIQEIPYFPATFWRPRSFNTGDTGVHRVMPELPGPVGLSGQVYDKFLR